MTDTRYQVGIGVTVAYVAALAIYAYVQRGPVLAMTPNEFGDALAGAASPLAFLWLVLGYLQQGDELRQNTEALRLQAAELKNSVEQQRQMVRAAEATMIATERPILTVKAEVIGNLAKVGDEYQLHVNFNVSNVGRTHAEKVFVHTGLITLSGQDFLEKGWSYIESLASADHKGPRPGLQVPPGESRLIPWRCSLTKTEIDKGRAYSDKVQGRLPSTVLLAMVVYESIMGSKHVTSVAYWVLAYDAAFQRNVDLPASDVVQWDALALEELQIGHGPTR